jgi:hypothetical protein
MLVHACDNCSAILTPADTWNPTTTDGTFTLTLALVGNGGTPSELCNKCRPGIVNPLLKNLKQAGKES